jgi:glutamine amidotransferase
MIAIIDYGMGNLGSVYNMLKKIGVKAIITNKTNEIAKADKLILPGVGSFDAAMKKIHEYGLYQLLNDLVLKNGIPILGICLGMQLLTERSDEGELAGFGWIKGKAYHFKGKIDSSIKVPHMGWNNIKLHNSNPLSYGFTDDARFYFVHSYFVLVENPINSIMKCNYGLNFDAAINSDNIYGAQFHPEKSHKFGMQFLGNFAEL